MKNLLIKQNSFGIIILYGYHFVSLYLNGFIAFIIIILRPKQQCNGQTIDFRLHRPHGFLL